MSGAYYNENEPFAAAWLRELIKADLIAAGEVDERSIEEVKPGDLRGFTQCHFFAGIGVWSYALRAAGWADDTPVWTGSCPCQSFSQSGQRGGFSDKRHLWPAWFRLIRECQPVTVFGEQVASKDGLAWLDVVSADMEAEGYAIGATDICAAGVGAPHIRQRLYFVAESERGRRQESEIPIRPPRQDKAPTLKRGRVDGLGHTTINGIGTFDGQSRQSRRSQVAARGPSLLGNMGQPESNGRIGRQDDSDEGRRECSPGSTSAVSELGDASGKGLQGREQRASRHGDGNRTDAHGSAREPGEALGTLAHTRNTERGGRGESERNEQRRILHPSDRGEVGATNGFWANAEWIYCRDEKYRPVEPGTFPLVNGTPSRVGRLRGYGNAINAEVAKVFIEAYMSIV